MASHKLRALCSASLACAVLGGALVLIGDGGEPGLAAASNHNRSDQDRDGLTDEQELQLGTSPLRADSDRDSYSDLEELARGSEPANALSSPDPTPIAMNSIASLEAGTVKMLVSVYVSGVPLDDLRLELGVIYRGRPLRLAPHEFRYWNGFLRDGRDAGDLLAVMEVGLPERLVQRLGRIHLFAVLRSTDPTLERMATTQSVASLGGFVSVIERRRLGLTSNGGGAASGVVYRPLAGDADLAASGWEAGQVCFQRTAAVGVSGASIVYEVDGADCIPMDTHCSPSDCAAGIGTSLDLPDPAALIGG